MTVNAIIDTKKGRTGIAPTYLHTTQGMSHAQLNMIRIALFCIASIWFFCSTVAV